MQLRWQLRSFDGLVDFVEVVFVDDQRRAEVGRYGDDAVVVGFDVVDIRLGSFDYRFYHADGLRYEQFRIFVDGDRLLAAADRRGEEQMRIIVGRISGKDLHAERTCAVFLRFLRLPGKESRTFLLHLP